MPYLLPKGWPQNPALGPEESKTQLDVSRPSHSFPVQENGVAPEQQIALESNEPLERIKKIYESILTLREAGEDEQKVELATEPAAHIQ